MKRIILILAGVLFGITLFQYLFYSCELKKKDRIIADKQEQITKCLSAPVKIDTLIIRTVLTDTVYLKFTHKVTDTVRVSDAVDWENHTIQKRQYTGTFTHPQFDLNWSADVTGTLDKMTINPPSLIRSMIITKEKTVDLTKYQECPKPERSHLYTDFGATFTGKEIQGIDLGLQYIRKEGWGLRGGIGTDFKKLTYHAGMVIRLK